MGKWDGFTRKCGTATEFVEKFCNTTDLIPQSYRGNNVGEVRDLHCS